MDEVVKEQKTCMSTDHCGLEENMLMLNTMILKVNMLMTKYSD